MPTIRSWLRHRPGAPAARPTRRLAIQSLEDRLTPTIGDLLHTLTPPSGAVEFGASVASSDQYVVVGAYGANSFAGLAAIYDATSGARLWNLTDPSATANDYFGQSVAVAGNLVVVGAPGDDTSGQDTGRAYVYDATTGNLVSTLVNQFPDPGLNPSEGFGDAVAITGDTVFVAADYDPHPDLYSGNVYEYQASTGNYVGALTPPSGATSSNFGAALAVSGNLLAVGAPLDGSAGGATGSVQLYDVTTGNFLRTIPNPGPSPAALDDFGGAVGLDGTTLVVGAPKRDPGGVTDVGQAYVFDASTGALVQTLNKPNPASGEWFGHGVAVSGTTVIVGAPYDNTQGANNGQAYVFDSTSGNLSATINNPVTSGTSGFGWATAAASDKLVAGAYFTGNAYTFQGRAIAGPSVTINQGASQNDPTNSTAIQFDVAFTAPVIGFDGSKVTLSGTAGGTLSAAVAAGSGANTYLVTVTGMTSLGTVVATIVANAVTDSSGHGNLASTSTDNTVTFDNVAPTVTIDQASGQADPTDASSIDFTVHFSKAVTGFTAASVDLSASTAGGTLVAAVSGSGADYTVTVTGMTSPGAVTASIPANAAADAAGNGNTASTSTDNTVAFDFVGTLQLSSAAYSVVVSAGSIFVTVTRTGGSANALSVQYATTDGTALAGTDYTATSGTLNWSNGEVLSKTFSVPIIDPGVPEADKSFTVALSNVNVAGALGTPTTATVTIDEAAALSFDAATYKWKEGDAAKVFVHRLFDAHGAATVDFAVGGGTATTGSDYGTPTPAAAGQLTWADGDNTDREIDIPILADGISDGRETIGLTLTSATGNAKLGAVSSATATIAPSNGKISGTSFVDWDNDVVTVKLTGPGTLMYFLTDGTGPISEIDLSGTDPSKSVVSIAVKKLKGGPGDGRVGLGEIDGDGSGVKSLSLGKADLVGTGINLMGFVGSLSIGAIKSGAALTFAGAPPKTGQSMRIAAGVIENGVDISVTGAPLSSLTATSIGQGNITASSVGSINIKGKAKTKTAAAIPGDFKSNVSIAGTGLAAKVPALKSLKVAGMVSGSTISVAGDVGTVSVGSFVNSQLLAGYTGADDGSGSFNLPSTVGPFTVRGATAAFSDSVVIASNFKNVSLASVDTSNVGTEFGFIYRTLLKALAVKSTGFKYDPNGLPEQDMPLSDFYIKKV